jgi:hypothetical protein
VAQKDLSTRRDPDLRVDHADRVDDQPDLNAGPSAYALAQRGAEVAGLTLHTDEILSGARQLQRQAATVAAAQAGERVAGRARQLWLFALTVVALWLAVLVVALAEVD